MRRQREDMRPGQGRARTVLRGLAEVSPVAGEDRNRSKSILHTRCGEGRAISVRDQRDA